jgi:uncharacterized membrane protein (DUF106 family)
MIELILALIIGYFIGFLHRRGIEARRRERLKDLLKELKAKAEKNRSEKNI